MHFTLQETLKIKNVCQNIAERNSHVWACSTLNFLAVQVKLLSGGKLVAGLLLSGGKLVANIRAL